MLVLSRRNDGFDGFAANVQFARKEVEQFFVAEANKPT